VHVPDDQDLAAFDPVDLWDREAGWLEAHFRSLAGDDWVAPSRCEGWSVRDILAHLAATEVYFRACLDGTVSTLMAEMGARGATDVASFNQLGIDDRAGVATDDLIATWSVEDAASRHGFRERGDGDVDSSVGPYPARWQAFHLAGELAVHADDVAAVVPDDARADRRTWRVLFSRFALSEHTPDLTVAIGDGTVRVRGDGIDAELDPDDFVELVAGREPPTAGIAGEVRTALSTMP
jgi:uncharacterized protein (TIGR03083 family)